MCNSFRVYLHAIFNKIHHFFSKLILLFKSNVSKHEYFILFQKTNKKMIHYDWIRNFDFNKKKLKNL